MRYTFSLVLPPPYSGFTNWHLVPGVFIYSAAMSACETVHWGACCGEKSKGSSGVRIIGGAAEVCVNWVDVSVHLGFAEWFLILLMGKCNYGKCWGRVGAEMSQPVQGSCHFYCHFFSVSFPAEAVELVPGLYFSARRRVGCRGTEKAHQSNNIEARSRAERNICHMYVFTW